MKTNIKKGLAKFGTANILGMMNKRQPSYIRNFRAIIRAGLKRGSGFDYSVMREAKEMEACMRMRLRKVISNMRNGKKKNEVKNQFFP